MEDQGIFKTSVIGGFNKQSVLAYVDNMIRTSQEKEEELKEQVEALTKECGEFAKKASGLQEQVASLQEQAGQASKEAQAAKGELEGKNTRIQALEDQLGQLGGQYAALQKRVAQGEEKGRKYDMIASQVGVVMVEAQKQADEILQRAHQQAQQIVQQAMDSLYEINQHVDDFKNDFYSLRSFAAQTMQAIDQKMADVDLAIKEAQGRLYIGAGAAGQEEAPFTYEEVPQPPQAGQQPQDGTYAHAAHGSHAPHGGEGGDFFEQPYQG